MSSRPIASLGVLLVWGSSLVAQDSAATLRRMESRLDSMQRTMAERDSAAVRADISDTVVVGGLRIATSPRFRPMAQVAAVEAWAALQARFGLSVEDGVLLPPLRFGSSKSVVPEAPDLHALARGFESEASQVIWRARGAEVLAWMHGSAPVGTFTPADIAGITEGMTRTPARPNRACLSGDAAACATALGVRLGADTLAEWYDPATWPRLAEMVGGRLRGFEEIARQNCIHRNDSTACRAILTPERVPLPVDIGGRQYLVQRALALGGPAAFSTLTAAGAAPISARLEAAAGIPIDTLVSRWSAAVRAAAPAGPAHPAYELFLAVSWSLALLLLIAARSGRWR